MRMRMYQTISTGIAAAVFAVVMVEAQGRGGGAGAPPVQTPAVPQISSRPPVDQAAHDRGRALWATHCIDCHGSQARG